MTLFVLLRVKQHDDTPATHKQVHWGEEHHLLPAPSPRSHDEVHEFHHKQKNCPSAHPTEADVNAVTEDEKTNAGRSAPPANSEYSSILLFCLAQFESCSPGASNTEATKHHKYK